MALVLNGLSSPSTLLASPSQRPAVCLSKTHLVSFPDAAVKSTSGRLSLSTSAARCESENSGRKWALSAATEAPQVEAEADVEAAEPEPVEVQIASVEASEESRGEEVFAVVMIGSRQYIVFPGRFIYTQRLKGANVNDKIVLNKVLLVSTKKNAYIGQPVVQNAVVHAVVEEQGLDQKVIVFKYKKKKHYRRTIGHRQPNTRLRIVGIAGYEDAPADPLPA